MLRKTKTTFTILILLAIISGCRNLLIPASYMPPPKEVKKNITGSWIRIVTPSDTAPDINRELYGELIAVQSDTVYALTDSGFIAVNKDNIRSAVLYIFKPPAGTISLITAISLLPNFIGAFIGSEYTFYFLEMGIPLLIAGATMAATEIPGNSRLDHPLKNPIGDFTKFARFPQGLPPGLNRNSLYLVTTK
jgi:hypothetical protein